MAAWVCDSCNTNNLAQATVCRTCRRAPGSVTGQVRRPSPDDEAPIRQQSVQPIFVESKHGRPSRPGPPAEPPRITLAPAPARGRAAPTPRRPVESPRRVRLAVIWLAIIGMATVVLLVIALGPGMPPVFGSATPGESPSDSSSGSAAAAQLPRPTPCPADVASWLPGGGDAILIAGYTTDKHVVTICRDETGQLYYDGQVKGTVADSQTHISLRATATATGFVANNKGYVYDISGTQLTVTNNGREILRATLTRTGP